MKTEQKYVAVFLSKLCFFLSDTAACKGCERSQTYTLPPYTLSITTQGPIRERPVVKKKPKRRISIAETLK